MLRNSPRENFGSKLWLFVLEWEKRNLLCHSEEYSSWMTPTGVLQISEGRREEGSTFGPWDPIANFETQQTSRLIYLTLKTAGDRTVHLNDNNYNEALLTV